MQTGSWLRTVREREVAEGVDHYELICHPAKLTEHVRERLERVREQVEHALSLLPDTGEGEEKQRSGWEGVRQPYIEALAAVLGDLGSALTAVGCTDKALGMFRSTSPDGIAASDSCDEAEQCSGAESVVIKTPSLVPVPPEGIDACEHTECVDQYDTGETVQMAVMDIRQSAPDES